MDKLDYLNQISKSNRTAKTTKSSSFNWHLVLKLIIGIATILTILTSIVVISNAGSSRNSDLTKQLYTRITNVNKTISTYNPKLKSSQLRSVNYSLSGILTATGAQLEAYIKSLDSSSKTPLALSSKTATEEELAASNINTTLYNAQLNGVLDRIYPTQIHLQVSLMMTMATELVSRDQDPALISIMDNFYTNLSAIEQTLDNYTSM